jgi:hypothetical protein
LAQNDPQNGTDASGFPAGDDRAHRRAFATALVGPNFLALEGLKAILSAAGFRVVASAFRVDDLVSDPELQNQPILLIVIVGDDLRFAISQIELFKVRHESGHVVLLADPGQHSGVEVEQLSALVGSSWGSVIALAFARRYPQRLASLVLSAPNLAKGHLAGEARDAELGAWLRTADVSIPVSRAAIADRLLAPTTPALVRRHVERLRDDLTTDGWRQAIRSLFTISTPDVILEIRCPIAILSGTRDRVAPYEEHAARLLASAPWAKSYPIAGCGHMIKLEAPAEFNSVVRQMAAEP